MPGTGVLSLHQWREGGGSGEKGRSEGRKKGREGWRREGEERGEGEEKGREWRREKREGMKWGGIREERKGKEKRGRGEGWKMYREGRSTD